MEELIGEELGVDLASLDRVERFLLRRYRRTEDALGLAERGVLDAAAHIGLVMLLNVDGAEWGINLENDRHAYYSLPIVRLSNGDTGRATATDGFSGA